MLFRTRTTRPSSSSPGHEPEHFTVLFRRHAPHIQRYVVRRLGADAADDIVAETFLLAFRQRDSYDLARADALARLSAKLRDTMLLAAWSDLSHEEIAVALGVPTGTVRSRLSRARSKLRQTMCDIADGSLSYNPGSWGYGADHALYGKLGSLPRNPIALDRYLAKLSYPNANATQTNKDVADFSTIERLMASAILPPSVNAALYRALGDIPTIEAMSHVTDVDGRPGVAFVLPETSQSANLEIILDASDCSYLAQAAWEPSNGSPNSAIPFMETAVLTTTLVSGPGSVQADSAPPSPAELTVEQAAMALLNNQKAGLGVPDPSQWIYRKLGTSGGTQEVWARADDTGQASYVNGTLVTCVRSASCASGTRWLMAAGPAFAVVDPPMREPRPSLPYDPQPLLDKLNTYSTGCPDTAGYCNAVGVIANMLIGYADVGISSLTWYFSLADLPGVTVKDITDAAGRADVEFSFPLTGGVTGILFDASTYQFAGYVKSGAQTLLLQQANVSGPGVLP